MMTRRRAAIALSVLASILAIGRPALGGDPPLKGVRRVVFLGDSITYAGEYIEYVEAYLRLSNQAFRCEFLDLGLPSETVSGLSEPGHAGGQFPRPALEERLARVLDKARPDLIVACYGMNDGIYAPFDESRLRSYRDGLESLREAAARRGAKVLLLTPPVFDPAPIRSKTLPAGLAEYRQPFEGYDHVLDRYSAWLLAQREKGWDVVDVHGPMKRHLARRRELDPDFRLAADGVHIDATGHWIIARELLLHWGAPGREVADAPDAETLLRARPHGLEVLKLVRERQRLLKDAWLTATGHKRPGMNRGLTLEAAERQAREVDRQISRAIEEKP